MQMRHFYIFLLTVFMFFQSDMTAHANSDYVPMTCEEKLNLLEPLNPKTIYDYELLPDRDMSKFKEEVFPIPLIQKKGNDIPFVKVYKDPNWQRPAYAPAWHSSSWRWSYVPLNLAHQQHMIYVYSGGLSMWYDLSNYLALPDGADGPSPINENAFTIKYPYVARLIVFNFNITSIKHYKHQIIVSGEPLRKGLTVVDFDTKNIPSSKNILQLVTPDGYEIDYLIFN